MRNYYEDLKLDSNCSDEDICESFRSLLKKTKTKQEVYKLAEAYSVLSNPKHRKQYTQFGEFGLKQGFTIKNQSIGGYKFVGNIDKVLLNFFGTDCPASQFLNFPFHNSSEESPPNDVTIEVFCSLEELFSGCRKNVQYSLLNSPIMWKTLEIHPGCETNHKFVFYGEGENSQKFPKSNLVFIIKEKPHSVYLRDGKNLIYFAKISLLQSLTANPIEIV